MPPSTLVVEPHIGHLLDAQLLHRHGTITIANTKYHPGTLLRHAAPHDYQHAAQLLLNTFPWIIGEHHDDLRRELNIPLFDFHTAVEDWISRREANLRAYFINGQLSPEACRKPLTTYLKQRFNPNKPAKAKAPAPTQRSATKEKHANRRTKQPALSAHHR